MRKYNNTPLEEQKLKDVLQCISEADQLDGQQADFEIVPSNAVAGGTVAPYYLLSYCDNSAAAYANVGYVLQKADLFIQSKLLGSGWFMGPKPVNNSDKFCIALAFGYTDIPLRMCEDDFKRFPMDKISPAVSSVARAVRLAPSSFNSQPWMLEFDDGKVVVKECGRGLMRVMLRGKLNKIDVGIAARHAVTTLVQEGKKVVAAVPKVVDKQVEVEIIYE